jgi:hypothetical protein
MMKLINKIRLVMKSLNILIDSLILLGAIVVTGMYALTNNDETVDEETMDESD